MSNYGMTVENLMLTLPSVLEADKEMNSLGRIIATSLSNLVESAKKATIHSALVLQDESVLDTLARDFKVEWYDYNHPLNAKREMIKNAMSVHRSLGTLGAVVHALRGIYDTATVEEWFDYGGEPYHFRIIISGKWSSERDRWARVAVNLTKNARSVLDSLIYATGTGQSLQLLQSPIGGQILYPICGTFRCGTHGQLP